MLSHLSIHNFAIVEHLDLEFGPGMTTITGETGAGKSIVLDALGLALGDRADSQSIMHGERQADISASFDLSRSRKAIGWLKEHELNTANEVILRRTITHEGRSRGFINGQPVPLQQLKTLGEMLIDIHNQHEHQSLLHKETHKRLVDDYGNLEDIADQTAAQYELWQQLEKRLNKLHSNSDEVNAKFQLLSYQVQELQALALTPGEITELEAEQKRLSQADSIVTNSQQILTICRDSDGTSLLNGLQSALYLLKQIPHQDKPLEDTCQLLTIAKIHIEEAEDELTRYINDFDINPIRLVEVENRLSQIYSIARKHKISADQLPLFQSELENELHQLNGSDANIECLEQETTASKKAYFDLAEELAEKRKIHAAKLSKNIVKQLKLLGMANTIFEISCTECQPSANGIEAIEFLISTNPGHTPRALNKIASGGELSRISLAIQVAAAKTSKIPALVFDEIDVGIGGATAEVVGNLLRQLGEQGQVICITHQAQVASKAHSHLFVNKKIDKKRVHTTLTHLDDKSKVKEIARMLGGIAITEQTIAHAEQMLSPCH